VWSWLSPLRVVVAVFAIVWRGGKGCGRGLHCIGGGIAVSGAVGLSQRTCNNA